MTDLPYGTWPSPIDAAMLSSEQKLSDAVWTDDDTIVWEQRSGTQSSIHAQTGLDAVRQVTPDEMNVGGRIGYGGAGFTVSGDYVYFVANGRIWQTRLRRSIPVAITPPYGDYAAPSVSSDGAWLAYIHHSKGDDSIDIVDTHGWYLPQRLVSQHDFVMQPVWHPLGTHLAYIGWNHPQMPWTGTRLYLATLAYSQSGPPHVQVEDIIAGDENTAIFQPAFSPDGRYLSYISDASGYGHLMLYDFEAAKATAITSGAWEVGRPAWVQGLRTHAWGYDSRHIYFLRNYKAQNSLWLYDLDHEQSIPIHETDAYASLEQIASAPDSERISLIASSDDTSPRLIAYSPRHGVRTVQRTTTEHVPAGYFAHGQAMQWHSSDGDEVHGLFYPPRNPDAKAEGLPPLILQIHGGPTSQRMQGYHSEVQFFTSRGYAVMLLNFRGSTGYGRAYMDAMRGQWGIVDTEDCLSAVRYLASRQLVDASRCAIMGGSSGGFTVLQVLSQHPGTFSVGICSYGVANHFAMMLDTHKFEAHYSDWLLGTLPDAASIYRERSPQFSADSIRDALIVFQGEDDRVVSKGQSDTIVAALRRNGVPHEYIVYAGEGHGFRKPETIEDFYQKVERFLSEHLIYA